MTMKLFRTISLILLAFGVAACVSPSPAVGQTLQQGGGWTDGLLPVYSGSGSGTQPIVRQSATAAGGAQSLKELSLIARGTGLPPFVGQGTGYLGSIFCLYDGPLTSAAGYHQMCLGSNVTGGKGLISYNALGGAAAQALIFNINGTSYEFPAALSGIVGPASSVVNDMACWNNTTGTLLKDCGAPILGPVSVVANNVVCWDGTGAHTLKDCGALPTGTVTGPGTTVANNMVTWNNTTGTLIKDFGAPPAFFDVRTYGATCNGVANDASAFSSANAAAAVSGGIINVPNGCVLGSTISVSSRVTFKGQGQYSTSIATTANNVSPFSLDGDGASVVDMVIDQLATADSSGCAISITANVEYALVQNVTIWGPFQGVCSTGAVATIQNVNVLSPTLNTGTCFSITGGANTYIIDSFCRGIAVGSQAAQAVKITGGGGHVLRNVQSIYAGSGLVVVADGVSIEWLFLMNNVFDSGTGTGMNFRTANGGTLKGVQSTGDWVATNTLNGIDISQPSGTVSDIKFVGLRSFGNGQHGVAFSSGGWLALTDSSICGNSTTSSGVLHGVLADTNATNVRIQNNSIGTCGGFAATQGYGVLSYAASIQITDNNLTGNATGPILFNATPTAAIIKDNLGVDNVMPTVASAASITLSVNPIILLSGTTTVTTIAATWPGRTVTLTTSGAGLYIGSAAQCATARNVYLYQYRSLRATYLPTAACWSIDTQDQQSPPSMAYANRPTTGLSVGMTITFTDSNTAAWGVAIAAGGANVVLGQWNGTNWTVVGI